MLAFWKVSFCEPFQNKSVSFMVSLRNVSESLLQLSFGCYEYVQHFWRTQECLLFQVPHLYLCPLREGRCEAEYSPVLLSFSAVAGGPAVGRELSDTPAWPLIWLIGGQRAWGALQQGPLAQSKCSQSHVLALLSRVCIVPWRYSFTGSLLVCSLSQQSFTSM